MKHCPSTRKNFLRGVHPASCLKQLTEYGYLCSKIIIPFPHSPLDSTVSSGQWRHIGPSLALPWTFHGPYMALPWLFTGPYVALPWPPVLCYPYLCCFRCLRISADYIIFISVYSYVLGPPLATRSLPWCNPLIVKVGSSHLLTGVILRNPFLDLRISLDSNIFVQDKLTISKIQLLDTVRATVVTVNMSH